MQPGYLPWLGFFELMQGCELFVFLDDVPYTKKDWRSRNRIRTQAGFQWLTVPVLSRGKRGQLISEAKVDNTIPWGKKHLQAIKWNYSKARCFNQYISYFEEIYAKSWDYLLDLDLEMIRLLAEQFRILTPAVKASDLGIKGLSGNLRVLEICKRLNATTLYDSAGAVPFIDGRLFAEAGIHVVFQRYAHPVYTQTLQPFLPFMSAIDLLFNEGANGKDILLSGKGQHLVEAASKVAPETGPKAV
ncbi:MAG: WbqC family protein [Candidatus Omnitrophota bacterium]